MKTRLNAFLVLILFSMSLTIGCSSNNDDAENTAAAPTSPTPSESPESPNEPCQTVDFPTGPALRYCIKRATTNNHTNIIYFFHGLGGSADDIYREPLSTALRLALESLGSKMPHVVSVSFGSSVPIGVDTSVGTSSLAGELITTGFPRIEQQLGFTSANPPSRQLMGVSMGGFNVLTVSASQPDLFKTVISLCPALIAFDPFDPAQVEAYIQRNEPYVNRSSVNTALSVLRSNFPTPQAWQSTDPLRQVPLGRYDSLTMFMSIGRQDEFGFIEGANAFSKEARARGLRLTYETVNGPHCVFDLNGLIRFLNANL